MTLSVIFTFAPIPLTNERSPLAHAAALVRQHQKDNVVVAAPRHRISPPEPKKVTAESLAA
jgi:hypothetical protein